MAVPVGAFFVTEQDRLLGLCTVVQCKTLAVYWRELRCMDARRSILLSSVLDIPWTRFKRSQASSDSGKLTVRGDVWKAEFGGILLVEIGDCCVFVGFRREVAENCALLGYYAASSGNSGQSIGPVFKSQEPLWILETSIRIYHCSLRNNPNERSSVADCCLATLVCTNWYT